MQVYTLKSARAQPCNDDLVFPIRLNFGNIIVDFVFRGNIYGILRIIRTLAILEEFHLSTGLEILPKAREQFRTQERFHIQAIDYLRGDGVTQRLVEWSKVRALRCSCMNRSRVHEQIEHTCPLRPHFMCKFGVTLLYSHVEDIVNVGMSLKYQKPNSCAPFLIYIMKGPSGNDDHLS